MTPGSADAVWSELADRILVIARELQTHSMPDDVIHLAGSELNVIRFVNRNPGSSPSDVALGTGLQRSNLSAALRALEARGLVERRVDPADARRVQLWHTAAADANLERLRLARAEFLRSAVGDAGQAPHIGAVEQALALLDGLEAGIGRGRRA